jgi:hypothetical protein
MLDILSKITLANTLLGGSFVALLGGGVRWLWKQFKRIDELEASLKVYGNAIDSLVSTLQQKSHLTAIVTLPRNSYQPEWLNSTHLLPLLQTPAGLNSPANCAA